MLRNTSPHPSINCGTVGTEKLEIKKWANLTIGKREGRWKGIVLGFMTSVMTRSIIW
jgi:hypothetical protein